MADVSVRGIARLHDIFVEKAFGRARHVGPLMQIRWFRSRISVSALVPRTKQGEKGAVYLAQDCVHSLRVSNQLGKTRAIVGRDSGTGRRQGF